MKLYVSGIVESYKYTIIGHLGNAGTEDLLLHIIQYWCACEFSKEIQYLHVSLYFSYMVYKYYYFIGLLPMKYNDKGNIYNEIFNNIPHFVKNSLHANFLQDVF